MAIKRYLGVKKEATYGQMETSGFTWLEAIESIAPDQGWIIPDSVGTRERRKKNLGPWRARGDIRDFNVEPMNCGDFLMGALGADSVGTVGGGYYAHTLTPADMIPSYSLKIGADIAERKLAGCLVSNISLKFTQGEEAKLSVGILQGAAKETTGSLDSPTFSELGAFVFHQAEVQIQGSNTTSVVYDAEVRINNGLIDRGALGSRFMDTKRVGIRAVNGKLSMFFKDTDEYNRFIAGTEFSLKITYTSGSNKLEVFAPKCVYRADLVPHTSAMNEPIVIDGDFEAFYDSGEGFEVRIILTNQKSGSY